MKTMETLDPEPFKHLIMTVGELPASFVESMTYYECLAWLVNYIQKNVVPAINNNADAIKAIQEWISTLDLQDEVDNKLDEMAEDGTLAEIIGEYLFSQAEYIFPKFKPTYNGGDVSIIRINNKVIMIDAGNTLDYDDIVEPMLVDNGISHIDYFIASHYDSDHTGNLSSLITDGYIDSNTVAYLSARVTTYGVDYTNAINSVITALYNIGATYIFPNENQSVTIESLTLTFQNCDAVYLDSLPEKITNNCSMFVLVEHGLTKALFTGDAYTAIMERMFNANFPKGRVNLFKVPHHGLDGYSNYKYLKKISPEYAVTIVGVGNINNGQVSFSQANTILSSLGTKTYTTALQPDYLKFISDGSSIQCSQGVVTNTSNARFTNVTYYVDPEASANVIQDGSTDKPFASINQALGNIPKVGDVRAVLNLADGTYTGEYNRPSITASASTKITINGNSEDKTAVVIPNIIVENSVLSLNNLTINYDDNDGIRATNATILINNVDIESSDGQSTNRTGVYAIENSDIIAKDLSIDNCSYFMIVNNGSDFKCNGTVTLKNATQAYPVNIGISGRLYTNKNLEFANSADKLAFGYYNNKTYNPIEIMGEHDQYANTIPLVIPSTDCAWIEIFYQGDGSSAITSTGKIYNPYNKYTCGFCPNVGGNGYVYNKQCRFKIDTNQITLDKKVQIVIDGTNTPTLETTANATKINVISVLASKENDVVQLS